MSNQVMYSLQKAEAAEALQWLEAPIPTIGEDDMLIKVRRTGICGTDIHIWDWDAWAQSIVPVPIITGHEFSGEVVEVGNHKRNRQTHAFRLLNGMCGPRLEAAAVQEA